MLPLHLDITIADLTNVHINPHPNVTVEDLFKVHAQSLDDDGLLQHDHFNAWVFHHDLVHHGPQAFHQFILQLGSPEIIEQILLTKTKQILLHTYHQYQPQHTSPECTGP